MLGAVREVRGAYPQNRNFRSANIRTPRFIICKKGARSRLFCVFYRFTQNFEKGGVLLLRAAEE